MKQMSAFLGALLLVACGVSEVDDPSQTEAESTGVDPSLETGAVMPEGPSSGTPSAPGEAAGDPIPGVPPGTPPATTPPTATGAFAGAPAYVATLGPSTLDTRGAGKGHLTFSATGNPAGQPCLDCHTGGKGAAPAFLFGGTVYEDAAATKPAARVEVRVLGAAGQGKSAYTDESGNFFFPGGGSLSAPSVAGVRTATVTRLMSNKVNDGTCNACHTTAMRIRL